MRKSRQYSKTGFYHVVIRGVNKQNIFYDREDKSFFLGLLKKYSKRYHINIHAYCLMENHVHLLLEDPHKNISIFMQSICSLYARVFNKKYDRIGHLFQERYASEVINDMEYFLTVFRYILQNPVKANISSSINYYWSSYKSYKNKTSFVYKKLLIEYFKNLLNMNKFLDFASEIECLDIELRPSERERNVINKIKHILNTKNPIIQPDLPKEIICNKVKLLKNNGLSINTISRITGISKHIVQYA